MKCSWEPRWTRKPAAVSLRLSLAHILLPPAVPATRGSAARTFSVKGHSLCLFDLIPVLRLSLRMCHSWNGVLSPLGTLGMPRGPCFPLLGTSLAPLWHLEPSVLPPRGNQPLDRFLRVEMQGPTPDLPAPECLEIGPSNPPFKICPTGGPHIYRV